MKELDRFNAVSPWYDRLSRMFFGNAIMNSQRHLIGRIPADSRVLILGGGTGEILPELFCQVKNVEVWFVDASSEMIRRATSRVSDSDKIQFIHGTHNDIPSIEFDVVMVCFFLDLFSVSDLSEVVSKITAHLRASGKLLVADFVADTFWHKGLLVMMYWFFSITTGLQNSALPPWNSVLLKHGYSRQAESQFFAGFIKSVCFDRA